MVSRAPSGQNIPEVQKQSQRQWLKPAQEIFDYPQTKNYVGPCSHHGSSAHSRSKKNGDPSWVSCPCTTQNAVFVTSGAWYGFTQFPLQLSILLSLASWVIVWDLCRLLNSTFWHRTGPPGLSPTSKATTVDSFMMQMGGSTGIAGSPRLLIFSKLEVPA